MRSVRRLMLSKTFLIVALVMLIAVGSISVYFLYPMRVTNVPRVGENRAAIVDGLSVQRPNPEFENKAVSYLTSAGLSVDVYNASDVTVDFMKSFPAGYVLVMFRIHSGTSRHGVFYFTSEPYDESKYEPEQFRDELRPGKDYEGNPSVFAFGSKFVDTYLQGRFQNTIVVGMGCFGAGTSYGTGEEVTIGGTQAEEGPNLADAFYRQGATAVIGWDVLVTLEFSDRVTLDLIRALAGERLTVMEATEKAAKAPGEGTRPFLATSAQVSVRPPACSTCRRAVSFSAWPCFRKKGRGTRATAASGRASRSRPSFSLDS